MESVLNKCLASELWEWVNQYATPPPILYTVKKFLKQKYMYTYTLYSIIHIRQNPPQICPANRFFFKIHDFLLTVYIAA